MEGLGSILLFAVFFYLMMRFGCGAHMMRGHASHGRSQSDDVDVKYIDPVCNREIDVNEGYGEMHKGTLYRFCSRDCLDTFDADPQRYLKKEPGKDQ